MFSQIIILIRKISKNKCNDHRNRKIGADTRGLIIDVSAIVTEIAVVDTFNILYLAVYNLNFSVFGGKPLPPNQVHDIHICIRKGTLRNTLK